MKRNVLQLIDSFAIGGTERQAVQLADLLRAGSTYRVYIGCMDVRGPLYERAREISVEEIPEFRLKTFYDVNFWMQIRRCVAFLKRAEIGIIHTHDFYTNIFGMTAGLLAGISVRIVSKRDILSRTRNQLLVERQAVRFADRITVNSEAIRSNLIKNGIPADKIVRVYNGLDVDRFETPAGFERCDLLKRLGINSGHQKARVVTIVANLRSDVKNHKMFLKAAEKIRSELSDVIFLLAGEGELSDSLKIEAGRLGLGDSVYFLGRVDDVPGLLSVSDVCLLTSKSEGFSNSILEYMAAGKPVVATDVGGAGEVVDDGETGFLVQSDDANSAATRVLTLLRDPDLSRQFGERGRQKVEQRYSLNAQIDQVLEMYDGLLRAKRTIPFRQHV
ncbi:MAG: glycosyltransferase [Pyrinomonadaceae bacterium]